MKIDNETFDNYYNNNFKFQKNIYKKIGILGHKIVPFKTESQEKYKHKEQTHQLNQNQHQQRQDESMEKSNDFVNKLLPLIESNNIKPNNLIEARFDINEMSLTNESCASARLIKNNNNISMFSVRPPSINELRNQLNSNHNNSSETNIVYQLSRIHLNRKRMRSKNLSRSLSESLLNDDEKQRSESLINSVDVERNSDD